MQHYGSRRSGPGSEYEKGPDYKGPGPDYR
jgi:hypothetical protein